MCLLCDDDDTSYHDGGWNPEAEMAAEEAAFDQAHADAVGE